MTVREGVRVGKQRPATHHHPLTLDLRLQIQDVARDQTRQYRGLSRLLDRWELGQNATHSAGREEAAACRVCLRSLLFSVANFACRGDGLPCYPAVDIVGVRVCVCVCVCVYVCV